MSEQISKQIIIKFAKVLVTTTHIIMNGIKNPNKSKDFIIDHFVSYDGQWEWKWFLNHLLNDIDISSGIGFKTKIILNLNGKNGKLKFILGIFFTKLFNSMKKDNLKMFFLTKIKSIKSHTVNIVFFYKEIFEIKWW